MKTHSGTKRRFSVTGTGKFMRMKGNKRHKKSAASRRTRAADEKKFVVSATHRKILKRLLPYGID